MKRLFSFALGLAACLAFAAPAFAENWPAQRITVIVPFGAGSVTDILARIFAEDMGRRWGQQVIVENRPGISGTAYVAKSQPDGYTLMVTSNGHTVSNLVSKDAPFDPVNDFSGVTRLGSAPLFLIVPPDLPVKTVKDVVDLANKQPGKLNFSSAGLASTTFIAGALFRKAANINIVHVPFRSSPDAVTAVMRGDAQLSFEPGNLTRDQAAAGKIKAIAAATPERIAELPDVPTFTEAGVPFVYDSWFGLMAPHGVPKPILDKIAKDWVEAQKSPDVQARIRGQFLVGVSDTPAAMDKIIRDDTASLTKIFKEAGL